MLLPSLVISYFYAYNSTFTSWTLDATLVIAVTFCGSTVAAGILPWRKPEIYNASPIAKYKVLGPAADHRGGDPVPGVPRLLHLQVAAGRRVRVEQPQLADLHGLPLRGRVHHLRSVADRPKAAGHGSEDGLQGDPRSSSAGVHRSSGVARASRASVYTDMSRRNGHARPGRARIHAERWQSVKQGRRDGSVSRWHRPVPRDTACERTRFVPRRGNGFGRDVDGHLRSLLQLRRQLRERDVAPDGEAVAGAADAADHGAARVHRLAAVDASRSPRPPTTSVRSGAARRAVAVERP